MSDEITEEERELMELWDLSELGLAQLRNKEVILRDDPKNPQNRQMRLCKCRLCKDVERCTPAFDFWTLRGDPPGAELVCQRCFERWVASPESGKPFQTSFVQ